MGKKIKYLKENWLKIYFIVSYILMLIFFIQMTIDIVNQPLEDKWEKAECPEVDNYRFLEVDCEKHITFSKDDKVIEIGILLVICLFLPLIVLLMFGIAFSEFGGGS